LEYCPAINRITATLAVLQIAISKPVKTLLSIDNEKYFLSRGWKRNSYAGNPTTTIRSPIRIVLVFAKQLPMVFLLEL